MMGILIGVLIAFVGTPLVRLGAGLLFSAKDNGASLLLLFCAPLLTFGLGAWIALSSL
ncbi:hypothetical protein [Streptomyces indicus]|uniref:Uncharacterized protein n=1 Tax=Streptomyces indicus TaxID=417292 RepID=A0A1G8TEB3_9ACTN|nr:hypothetical protein [Streptomyces indicus]SDJ39861.1 hypothetical protein SAMN05421806_101218 [Streptomyces indicus]